MNAQPEIHSGGQDEAALGRKETERRRALDTFEAPKRHEATTYQTDEVTANCPITGQPDWYTVTISIGTESKRLIESKSLKLYLQSFREEGMFCEAFADQIVKDVAHAIDCDKVQVTVLQKPRGGVSIKSTSAGYLRGQS